MMKIDRIQIDAFLGARRVDVELPGHVMLFAGPNGAGKSSIRDAIALAFTGDLSRVAHKKHSQQLVSDGAKAATIRVRAGGAEYGAAIRGSKVLDIRGGSIDREGKTTDAPNRPEFAYVLDAQRFASLDEKGRAAFLFGLMGLKRDAAAVRYRMSQRGCDVKKTDTVLPLLRTGFEAAHDDAKRRAAEARGAWKAVAGENYGSDKAIAWQAEAPLFDPNALPRLRQAVEDAEQAVAAASESLGTMREAERHRQAAIARAAALREQLKGRDRAQRKLDTDVAELERVDGELAKARAAAGTGPRVGLLHDLAAAVAYLLSFVEVDGQQTAEDRDAQAALDAYEREQGKVGAAGDPGEAARAKTLEAARTTCERTVANDRAALKKLDDDAAELQRLEAEPAVDAPDIAAAESALAELRKQHAAAAAELDKVDTAKRLADAAEQKTRDAAGHHAAVEAWVKIAEALAPDGIPAELLSEALGPINDRLMQSAIDAEWPRPGIDGAMAITVGEQGRPYALLSESEQWRVDAMLAEAIAHLSGVKLLVLDRADVLDAKGREDLWAWLDVLASSGEIDTALVFATLPMPPHALPETIDAVWIDAGVASNVQQQREAA
jgi:hypothetical protein